MTVTPPSESDSNKPTYRWPRYVLAAVILGIILSVIAVIKEARRVSSMEHDPVFPSAPKETSP